MITQGMPKSPKCLYCGEKIKRHDTSRVTVQVAVATDHRKVHKEAHLKCHQEAQHG
jgi:hypothetical protein